MADAVLLTLMIFIIAVLYSSVGQAGGTGYLAAMALLGFAPETMRPTALALNVIVASIATLRFHQAGRVSLTRLWPFLVTSIPLAYLGGTIHLSASIYGPIVGVVLIGAAIRLLIPLRPRATDDRPDERPIPLAKALLAGGGIGFLSGLTGTGGGIYLSPLLTFTGWTAASVTGGMSAVFNLVNSGAALTGNLLAFGLLPSAFPVYALAAVAGGFTGATWGSRRLDSLATQRLLAVILVIAGVRLFFL